MNLVIPPSRSGRLTALLALWIVAWLILGTMSFLEVRALTSLSDTMAYAGRSLDEAGESLDALASIPLIGSGLRPTAERVQSLATSTITEAEASRTHISRLSVLAVLIGCVIPIAVGVGVYLVARRGGLRA